MHPFLFVLDRGVVRVLIACACCSRTVALRWPSRRAECLTCAAVELVDLRPVGSG